MNEFHIKKLEKERNPQKPCFLISGNKKLAHDTETLKTPHGFSKRKSTRCNFYVGFNAFMKKTREIGGEGT